MTNLTNHGNPIQLPKKRPPRLLDLTPRAQSVTLLASAAASDRGSRFVTVDDFLIAIARLDKGVGANLLSQAGITEERILAELY